MKPSSPKTIVFVGRGEYVVQHLHLIFATLALDTGATGSAVIWKKPRHRSIS